MKYIRNILFFLLFIPYVYSQEITTNPYEEFVKSLYLAASSNDVGRFTTMVHSKSYYGNGEVGAKALMKEINIGSPQIISIKHIGTGKIREYVEVHVNRTANANLKPSEERKTVFYLVSIGNENGRLAIFSSTLVADGVELMKER